MSMEEVEKIQPKPRLPQDRTGAFAFTLDGGRMVSAPNDWSHDDSKVVVYDTENWKPVATLDIVREGAIVTGLAITPDGKRVFIAGLRGGNIRVWDVTAKKYEETQFDLGGLKFDRWRLRMAPDGKALVAGMFSFDDGVGSFRVWDVSSGKVIRTFDSRHTAADGFRFIDGGAAVAALTWTGTREDVTAWVGEWDLATGKEKQRIDVRKAVGGDRGPLTAVVEYSADGKHVVIGGGFRLADEPPPPPDSYRNTFPYSGSVWVIDRQSGKLVKTLIDRRYDLVRSLHLTHDAKKLIVNPEFPSRWERRLESDAEFVELQQWDVATWELDWVKIVPKAERWKLWNGAAK
jgi:WD40 repeat protein